MVKSVAKSKEEPLWTLDEFGERLGWKLPYVTGGELLTEQELSVRLNLSTRQIRELARRGLPRTRVGGAWRYPELDCYHWWGVYTVHTERYRRGQGEPVRALTLDEARAQLMDLTIEAYPERFVRVPRRLAELSQKLEGEWPEVVVIPRRLADGILDELERRLGRRRTRTKARSR